MNSNIGTNSKPKRYEITIAVMGLIGVLGTAIISNLDKMLPDRGTVTAPYVGYRPTGNFETEFRYYFEVAGLRANFENMQSTLVGEFKSQLISLYPDKAADIQKAIEFAVQETPKFEDVFVAILPMYRKYFTIEEIQELNRFYSTNTMQDMVKKQPLLTKEIAPVQVKILTDAQNRMMSRMQEEFSKSK